VGDATESIAEALEAFDFRRATEAVWQIADQANRYVNRTQPWQLARTGALAQLNAVLSELLSACQAIGTHLVPFLPDTAAHITRQCTPNEDGLLPSPVPILPRITPPIQQR
jgi:methionyl-tRNA synthetase